MKKKKVRPPSPLHRFLFGERDGEGRISYGRGHWAFIYIMLAVMGACTGVVSLLLASTAGGTAMFWSYFSKPLILLLNILPCVLLVYLGFFMSGRAWIGFLVPSAIIMLMSLIDHFKMQIRNEPFFASDFVLAREAGKIMSQYTLTISAKVIVVPAALVFGTAFAVFFMRGTIKKPSVRVIGSAAALVLIAALFFACTGDKTYDEYTANEEDINTESETMQFVSKGFIYPFMYDIRESITVPPQGYSSAKAKDVLAGYDYSDIDEDKKVNVICVMLESFSDFSEYDSIDFTTDVYAPLHRIEAESYSGSLVSNIFAGGTIDTERAFLTGYNKYEDYGTDVNSYVWYFDQQGYYTEGLHVGDEWFYNRQNVNRHLGFDNYYFLCDFKEGKREDEFFFGELSEMYLEAMKADAPYFNFSVSYQNHGAYLDDWTGDVSYLSGDGLSDSAYCILNNYFTGIYDTNLRIERFVDSLRDSEEPVVVVMFGDHKPWLGNGDYVYHELGINIDVSTEEGFYNYYSTPYFIWANGAAKEALGNDFQGDGGDISACFLMNKLFEMCSWDGNEYLQLTDRVMEATPVISTAEDVYLFDGELTADIPEKYEDIMRDYAYAQYYLKHSPPDEQYRR